MANSNPSGSFHNDSPDPSSHAVNMYDASGAEGEWLDETEDDDDMFEPTTDESEDAEFFDPFEDDEAEFHGMVLAESFPYVERLPSLFKRRLFANASDTDAEDGVSGVEIEFSVQDGGASAQDDGGTETEAGDSRLQVPTATRGPSRRHGQ